MKILDIVRIKKDKLNYYYLFTILTFLFISYYFENHSLITISIFLSLFFSFLNPVIIGIPLLIMSTFDDRVIFLVTERITLSRLIIICIIISILLKYIIVKQKLHIKPNKGAIIFVFFLFFINIFSIFNSLSQNDSIISFFSISLNIIFFFEFISLYNIEDELLYNQIIIVVTYTIFFFFIWIFTKDISGFNLTNFLLSERRLVLIAGEKGSVFARSLAFGLILIFYHIINKKVQNVVGTIILYFVLIIGFFMLMSSGTRTPLYATLISMLFLSIICITKNKKFKLCHYLNIFTILCILVGLLILYTNYFPIFSRYSLQSIIQSGGTGRFDAWKFFIEEIFPKYYLYGTGLGGTTEKIAMIKEGSTGLTPVAHNIFLQILIELGILGLIIYGMFFFVTFKKGLYAIKNNFPFIVPYFTLFVICIFIGLAGGMFTSKIFWISIAFVWRYSSQYFKKEYDSVSLN